MAFRIRVESETWSRPDLWADTLVTWVGRLLPPVSNPEGDASSSRSLPKGVTWYKANPSKKLLDQHFICENSSVWKGIVSVVWDRFSSSPLNDGVSHAWAGSLEMMLMPFKAVAVYYFCFKLFLFYLFQIEACFHSRSTVVWLFSPESAIFLPLFHITLRRRYGNRDHKSI